MALADTMPRQPGPGVRLIELNVQITFVQFSAKKMQTKRGDAC